MKKTLLAVLAGFTVAFVAGAVTAPKAEAQTTPRCRTNSDCTAYGQTHCAGDPGYCWHDDWYGQYGYCYCP
ncbi:hypothetical protein [Pyxidicoccus xibeiensis]|uniref:hypothetical protein n=1 Tax=Pyxidicoccus xibeiensis TaxID=2906759 RepID=UPI0020A74490|nr:hypothetical protein [Pyxidicoccus xibeiensis]MCP3139293.1 hypothetical protein [Pyxidicoccus xibeiensis]